MPGTSVIRHFPIVEELTRENLLDLSGAKVVLWPDNDQPGLKRMREATTALQTLGRGITVCVLDPPPGIVLGGDIIDAVLTLGWDRDAIDRAIASATPFTPPVEAEQDEGGLDESGASPPRLHLTDLGNAERLVSRHGRDIRYCHSWKKWLCWDGRRWKVDETGGIERLASETVRSIYHEITPEDSKEEARKVANWAHASESAKHIRAMLKLAPSQAAIPVLPDELDRDGWLLNCSNGTVDLRTGQIRSHAREDLITRICPVKFTPDA